MKNKKPILFFVLLVFLFVMGEYFTPKQIDWSRTLMRTHSVPLGTMVVYDALPDLFKNCTIEENGTTLLQLQRKSKIQNTNLLFISQFLTFDNLEVDGLLNLVDSGNTVLISANDFSRNILDTLNISVNYYFPFEADLKKTVMYLNFVNKELATPKGYLYDKICDNSFFTSFDTSRTTVLGKDNSGNVNFIRMNIGKGFLFLHTQPLAFTNYYMVKYSNYEYVSKVLSYLPVQKTIWDEYYKPGRVVETSSLRYVMSKPPLKVAWYLILLTALIYMIFEAKRQQRIIPVIKPPVNSSLEFAETMGRLYLSVGNHKDLIHKKFNYFTEFIRTKYYIRQINYTDEFYKKLAEKSGVSSQLIKSLFEMWRKINQGNLINEETMVRFTKLIEDFYKKSK